MTVKTGARFWVIGCVMAAILTAGMGVSAQDGAGEEKNPVSVTLNMYGEYTDNRDSTADGESTFDFYLQPRLNVMSIGERLLADFYYAPSYRYRTDASDYQNDSELFHDLGLNLELKTSDVFKLHLKEYFNLTDDPSVTDGGVTIRRDSSFIYNRVEGGIAAQPNRQTSLGLGARNTIKRYDDNVVAADSDEDSVAGMVNVWRQIHRQTALTAMGEVSQYSYESALGLDRGFDMITGAAGIETIFSPELRGSVQAGVQAITYDDPGIEDETAPVVSVSARANPNPGTEFSAAVKYGIRSSDVYPFASQKLTELTARMDWELQPKLLLLGVSGTYRVGSYEEESLPIEVRMMGLGADGDRTSILGSVALTYLANDWTSVELSQHLEDVDSDVDESFTKNTTRLKVSRRF